ncbi:MAG: hydroxymethylbilane synthase [Cellulomonas sp.]|nr:hydroxymethylbilane synthase [Cellulomonas sp.]
MTDEDAAVLVGTRASELALTQTGHVADALRELGLRVDTVRITTHGDVATGPLSSLGGTGVFAAALREALLDGRCDLAVHSLKDLPTAATPGLVVAAVPPRADPRDVLCSAGGARLDDLPPGATVGTGSPRRAAQLRALRPDLQVVDLRGNVGTRLARALGPDADLAAVVLARAGLARLGRLDAVGQTFSPAQMLPAPGQGALAVEIRAEDRGPAAGALAAALARLDDPATRLAVTAERALLVRLEAGCTAPVGALARAVPGGFELDAVVAAVDGSLVLRRTETRVVADVAAAEALGRHVADLLLDAGAADLVVT